VSFKTKEDIALTQAAPGVLSNASDPDGGLLTASLASSPLHGNVSLSPDGSFVYTPAADFNGQDSFNFTVSNSDRLFVVRQASRTIGEFSVCCMTVASASEAVHSETPPPASLRAAPLPFDSTAPRASPLLLRIRVMYTRAFAAYVSVHPLMSQSPAPDPR
jgi:hypothetical protein